MINRLILAIKKRKRTSQAMKSLCIFGKTFLGVVAFKATETAMHTTNFETMAVAGAALAAILLPVWGLMALADD